MYSHISFELCHLIFYFICIWSENPNRHQVKINRNQVSAHILLPAKIAKDFIDFFVSLCHRVFIGINSVVLCVLIGKWYCTNDEFGVFLTLAQLSVFRIVHTLAICENLIIIILLFCFYMFCENIEFALIFLWLSINFNKIKLICMFTH